MQQDNWTDTNMRCFGMLLDGRAQTTGIKQRGREATLLIVINDHHDLVEFTLPECPGGDTWSLLIDTNIADNSEEGTFKTGDLYKVTARSLLVLALQAAKQ
jgi:glycogen operon protein